MNIVQINNFIKKIANCTELVHSFYTDSVYECWNSKGNVDYGSVVFCIKKTRMRERTMIYDAIMYYGDRLLDDKSNRDAVWADATNVIQSIIGTINNIDGNVSVAYPYDITLFEQDFADELAGAYASISVEVEGVGECGDLLSGYEDNSSEEIKLENITRTFTVNGTYDVVSGEDYDAISMVRVIVDVPLQEKSVEIQHNGSYTITPDEGYEGVTSIDIDVDVPLQPKSVNIEDNGSYTITPDEEYDGLTNIDVNVEIPLQEKSVTYLEAGSYEIVPDDEYKALTKVNVEVSLEGKQIIPNGFRFTGGDLSTVEWDKYDWSMVYDTSSFFENCTTSDPSWTKRFEDNFNGEFYAVDRLFKGYKGSSVPLINDLKPINTSYMFYGCVNLEEIPQIDTSNSTDTSYMFVDCKKISSIPYLDISNSTNTQNMFCDCTNLTSVALSSNNKSTTMNRMFSGCTNLEEISQIDTSNSTNLGYMFCECKKLRIPPVIEARNATNIGSIFQGCSELEEVRIHNLFVVAAPNLAGYQNLRYIELTNCTKTTGMNGLFKNNKKLENVVLSGTQNVTNFYDAFGSCSALKTVSELDISSCTNFNYVFQGCYALEEVRLKGNPSSITSLNGPFSLIETNGTLYYDDRYDYSRIINTLPSTWTAVPYTVVE